VPDIRQWLEAQGLGKHADTFIENEIDLEALPHLTEAMLKEMGLSIGARAKILAGIADLKETLAGASPAVGQRSAPGKAPARPAAERRQLTVLFCDLVGSTALSEALDPEDLRALIGAYQAVAGRMIGRYDGHVAQFLGDGIMAYFGWPNAHEDDAERALRASLEILRDVKAGDSTNSLRLRIGIATGLVVVGESDGAEPNLAVGETPNLAARLQSLAGVDEIVIGPTTRRLVGRLFDLVDLGPHVLKGFAEPVPAYRVTGLSRTESRFDARPAPHLPFVGRTAEMDLLQDRWARAKDGHGQVVLLEGEAGIGKSRLLHELCRSVEPDSHGESHYHCSPYHQNSAFYPFVVQLERLTGFEACDDTPIRLAKLRTVIPDADQNLALLAALLGLKGDDGTPLNLSPQKRKEQTLAALVHGVKALAEARPQLVLIEDAHWIDPSSYETLALLFSEIMALPLLAVITFRPGFQASWAELPHASLVSLGRLDREEAKSMVEAAATELPDDLRDKIVARTDGVPLFVEELTGALLDGQSLVALESALEPANAGSAIPVALQNALTARLDRLGPHKELAQTAACIGRSFSRDLLASIKAPEESTLDRALEALVESGVIHRERSQEGSGFAFRHALIQQTAYESLLKSKRRAIHGTIAATLIEEQDRTQHSDLLMIAQHLRLADRVLEALPWMRRAAQQAANSGAFQEALSIANRALELVGVLDAPPEECRRAELALLVTKLPLFIAVAGWSDREVEETCHKALDLAVALGDRESESAVLYRMATMHEVRGQYSKTQEVLKRREAILRQPPEPVPTVESGELMACSTFYQGRLETSIENAKLALQYVDPQDDTALGSTVSEDPTIACLFWIAKSLLLQGKLEEALGQHTAAFERARHSPNWYAASHAEIDATLFFAYQRDYEQALAHARRASAASALVGLAYRKAVADLIAEWAQNLLQESPPNLEKMRANLTLFRQVGAMIGFEFYLALGAETHARAGDFSTSDTFIQEALRVCGRDRGFFFESELHRLQGSLLLLRKSSDAEGEAEACFRRALKTARAQGARFFELRAANALAQLWLDQGRKSEARDLLAPIYNGFSEASEAGDLLEAKRLLAALA
jgi:class 3 adenylate cyclase/tetratricopeptide (TPR) repeat protein